MKARIALILVTVIGVLLAFAIQQSDRAVNPYAAGDTWTYYTVDPADPYGEALSGQERVVFVYSPAAAQAMSLLRVLPWEVVRDGWAAIQLGLLAVLAGPFTLPLAFTTPVQWELTLGNVSLLLAAVSVAGLRWPALWSIGIFTKLTPGIGLLWFVSRREWRKLGIAVGVSAAVFAVSFALAPSVWLDWFGTLYGNRVIAPTPGFWIPPWPVRVAIAAALIWYGARRDWRWVVPLAVMLSTAHLWSYALVTGVGSLWYVWAALRRGREHLALDVGIRVRRVWPLHRVDA